MCSTTLVIMAAGLGSRYGTGIKQLEKVGPSGEIIMEYSIHDAIEAGFDKVVFIIRRDLERDFKEIIGDRISKKVNVAYAFQELEDLPVGFVLPEGRTKPWGTGQAVLSCKGIVKEPFMVINADDYYGKEAYAKFHEFLSRDEMMKSKGKYCMAGFVIGNTLSDNGVVTRGLCLVDRNSMLKRVEETFDLKLEGEIVAGKDIEGKRVTTAINTPVSMNMWGFTPDFLDSLEKGFCDFLKGIKEGDIKSEYLLPQVVGEQVAQGKVSVEVLSTADKWFGVTYHEDKEAVSAAFQKLVDEGRYPNKLFD